MADDPRKTAFDNSAPADERQDANTQLTKSAMPTALSDLIPAADIRPIIDHIQNDLTEAAMQKAIILPFPDGRKKGKPGPQSVWLDDLQIFAHADYWERPSPLGYDSLRNIVDQTPILNAVIMTRIRQISRFCRPQEESGQPGFEIRHKDMDHQIQPDEEKSIAELQAFICNSGWESRPRVRQRMKRANFQGFMAKLIRDSLTLDSAPIETEMKRDRRQGIDGFYAVDGSTIRLCSDKGYQGDDEIFAVQVIQGQVRTAYTYDDLIYVPRNPRTDVRIAGYGMSECELLVRVVTGFLNAMNVNIKGFSDNSIPRGMLHLSGDYDQNDLQSFRQYWAAMVKGVNNTWTVPVMVSKDQESRASFENFGIEFNEMYFAKWMTFLTSIICAIYGMSPNEINFDSFADSKSSLSGSDTAEKLAESKDKGLRPLMGYFESLISDYIIADFSDKYVFRWAGLDPENEDKRHEMRKLVLTVNEVRAQEGYDALEGPLGDAPINPSLIGAWTQENQPDDDFGQPDEVGGQEGGGGQDGGRDGPQPPDEGGDRRGDFGKGLNIYRVE